jgi:hypothetical protein
MRITSLAVVELFYNILRSILIDDFEVDDIVLIQRTTRTATIVVLTSNDRLPFIFPSEF